MDAYLLTINSKDQVDRHIKIAERGMRILPKEVRGEIESIGNVAWPDDGKILFGEDAYRVFLFNKLIRRLRGYKSENRLDKPILGLTTTLVIRVFSYIDTEKGRIRQSFFTINDYMHDNVGFVYLSYSGSLSYSEKDENISSISIAHGLGHNSSLGHHEEPKGIMYWREPTDFMPKDLMKYLRRIYENVPLSFCPECENTIKKNKKI